MFLVWSISSSQEVTMFTTIPNYMATLTVMNGLKINSLIREYYCSNSIWHSWKMSECENILTKMCINGTYNKVRVKKHLSDAFCIQNCMKEGDALLPFIFIFVWYMTIGRSRGTSSGWNWMGHINVWSCWSGCWPIGKRWENWLCVHVFCLWKTKSQHEVSYLKMANYKFSENKLTPSNIMRNKTKTRLNWGISATIQCRIVHLSLWCSKF